MDVLVTPGADPRQCDASNRGACDDEDVVAAGSAVYNQIVTRTSWAEAYFEASLYVRPVQVSEWVSEWVNEWVGGWVRVREGVTE